MEHAAPPPPDLDDDSAQARGRRLALARESAADDERTHRRESGQRHEAASQRLDRHEQALTRISERLDAMETIARETRGAMRFGAAVALAVAGGVAWLVLTTIDSRQAIAVHSVEIAGLHSEDDASKTERRELREAVTRAAAAVERVAGSVEAVGDRVDRVEEEVREQRTRGR